MLGFEKLFDMFSLVGLFPIKCEKQTMQYYFDYSASSDQGLDYEDFRLFMCLIGLEIIQKANKALLKEQSRAKLDTNASHAEPKAEVKIPKEPVEMVI